MATEFEITNVGFDPEGLLIQYMAKDDVRVGGRVLLQHQLRAHASHPDYREDMALLHDLALRVLRNILEDFNESEPHVPETDVEPDEDTGLGM